jgi:hypothetical protein
MAVVLGLSVLGLPDTGGAATDFTTYSLRGTYRVIFTGFSVTSGRLESGLGFFVADGLGHLTGTETFNRGTGTATAVCNVTVTGTYAINANGTGTLRASFTSPTPGCSGEFTSALMLFEGSDLVRAVSTDPGFVTVSEEWRRQIE